MEENASSTENLVFAQSLSHEQLQNNREVLARRLQLRRPREELVNQGIIPAVSAAPIILQQRSRLERAKTSDILQRKIRVRPDRNQLIQRHILEDSNADPSIQARQISLKRKKLQDDLNERLLMRPGPLELVNKNILDPGSFVGHAIKEGAVEYSDTKDSTLIVNALSPPESFNDDSPQPSPDNTSSLGSPCDLSPTPLFPAYPKVFISGESQFKAFSESQNKPINYPPANNSKLKSRKKASKAKFKKYKYHEYRPPNIETSSSKSDTTLPTDSPYSLLLQQQQLYLQLQVLCQNYPQTFLPMLPAVQKNTPADNTLAEKPMKLEEMRVIDLRNELKSRGLPVSGSKNNLMERLKLANAAQDSSQATPTSTSGTQSTPVTAAPRAALSRSSSAPGGVALVNSIRPGKILNDAEKILQLEQNISVEEIQQKIQQLQYLNLQLQLQQLDLKKNQQGKPLQPKPLPGETTQQIPTHQLPLQHHSPLPQPPSLSQHQLQPQQPQQNKVQLQQQQTIQVQQQRLEQHLQQLKQIQQQQQHLQSEQQQSQEQNQQLQQQHIQQQQQLKHQQFQQHLQQQQLKQQFKSQQQQSQQQSKQQFDQQQQLYNQLSVSQTSNIPLSTESSKIPSSSVQTIPATTLPQLQQCQVSVSATPLLHCSALTCNKNCNHMQLTSTSSLPNILNSVQQHNVIHFKQPVKPVILLQPPKRQQKAELLFSPSEQQITAEIGSDAFFQQLKKNEGISSAHGDIEPETNWQAIIDADLRSPTSSPTSLERSPPPYYEAVAGRLSPRSASFSTSSLSNGGGVLKTNQRTSSCGSTSPLAHRRSLSVPSVNHGSHQHREAQQELQKGHKSVSMCLDFPEAEEMSDLADNYHGITQELQKAMIIESQNNVDNNRNAELLEILGDTLFPSNSAAGSTLSSSSPNLNTFSPFPGSACGGGRQFNSSSPKAPRSPTTNLPSYQEAVQNSFCVQSPPAGTTFTTNELLNGYHDHSSPVNITPGQRKISSPNIEDSLLPSPGSPMRMDTEDIDLLQRSVLDANGYRRDSFNVGDLRTQDARNNSLYHVNPSDIFGNPQVGSSEVRLIKQEDTSLQFLEMDAAEFAESMDFGMAAGDSGISMSGITFSQ